MDIFDLLSFYYHLFMAAIFRKNACEENLKKAMKFQLFQEFQTTKDRNQLWMSSSLRDRNILVECVITCTLGIKHDRLQHAFYNIIHLEAENKRLQSFFNIE